MRSLPEKDFWDTLRTRLRNYEEEPPTDDWELIAAALKPRQPLYRRRGFVALMALLLISTVAVWVMVPTGTEQPLAEENAKQTNDNRVDENGLPQTQENQASENNTHSLSADGQLSGDASHQAMARQASEYNTDALSDDRRSPEHAGHQVSGNQSAENTAPSLPADHRLPEQDAAEITEGHVPSGEPSNTGDDGSVQEGAMHTAAGNQDNDGVSTQLQRKTTRTEYNTTATSVQQKEAGAASSATSIVNPRTTETIDQQADHGSNAYPQISDARTTGVAATGEHNTSVSTVTNAKSPYETQRDGQPAVANANKSTTNAASSEGTAQNNHPAGDRSVVLQGNEHDQPGTVTEGQTSTSTGSAATPGAQPGIVALADGGNQARKGTGVTAQAKDSVAVPEAPKIVETKGSQKAGAAAKKEQEQKKKAWHPVLYASLTPSLAFQKITPLRNDNLRIAALPAAGIFSSNRMGISLETGGQITLQKGFELYGGLLYYQQNQSISYQYYSSAVGQINPSGEPLDYDISPQGGTHTFRYAMHNVGASAGFLYTVKDARLMHKIGGGLQYQYGLSKARGGDTYENRRSQYLNYQVHYRLEWAGSGRTRLFVQPVFIHSFWTKENLREPLTIKPYRVGITFGVTVAL